MRRYTSLLSIIIALAMAFCAPAALADDAGDEVPAASEGQTDGIDMVKHKSVTGALRYEIPAGMVVMSRLENDGLLTQLDEDFIRISRELDAISKQSALAMQAMQEIESGDANAANTVAQLVAQNPDYADTLENMGNVIAMNAEKVRDLKESQINNLRWQVSKNLSTAFRKYSDFSKEIQGYTRKYKSLEETIKLLDGDKASSLISLIHKNSRLRTLIAQYNVLSSSLDDINIAYQEWLHRTSFPAPDAMYYEFQNAYSALQYGLEYGKTGKGTYYSAAEQLLFKNGVYTEIGEKYAKRYFRRGDSGDESDQERQNMENFLNDLVEWGYMEEDDGNYSSVRGFNIDDFATKSGLSKAAILAIFKNLLTYEFEISWSQVIPQNNKLNELYDQLDTIVDEAATKINELDESRSSNPDKSSDAKGYDLIYTSDFTGFIRVEYTPDCNLTPDVLITSKPALDQQFTDSYISMGANSKDCTSHSITTVGSNPNSWYKFNAVIGSERYSTYITCNSKGDMFTIDMANIPEEYELAIVESVELMDN